jgi:hypothetical protein
MTRRRIPSLSSLLLCTICAYPASGQVTTPSAVDASRASQAPAAPAAEAPAAASKGAQNEAGEPRVHSKELTKGGAQSADDKRTDRVELDTSTITGNRELPKVLYIVPWKKSDIGDLTGKPMNSLLDEVLAPVDRDVFRREVTYFHAVNAPAGQNSTPPVPPPRQGEK